MYEFSPEMIDELIFVNAKIPEVKYRIDDFIYFITDGEFVKVGKGSPLCRLKSLQTGNARELNLLFTIPIGQGACWFHPSSVAESALHLLFKKYRIRGEWFDILQKINVKQCIEYFGTITSTSKDDVNKARDYQNRR